MDKYYWGRYYSPHSMGATHNEYSKYAKYHSSVLYKKGADLKFYGGFSSAKHPNHKNSDAHLCPQVSLSGLVCV